MSTSNLGIFLTKISRAQICKISDSGSKKTKSDSAIDISMLTGVNFFVLFSGDKFLLHVDNQDLIIQIIGTII
jgi:hypothetical protein